VKPAELEGLMASHLSITYLIPGCIVGIRSCCEAIHRSQTLEEMSPGWRLKAKIKWRKPPKTSEGQNNENIDDFDPRLGVSPLNFGFGN
jgi:hypothetical protein